MMRPLRAKRKFHHATRPYARCSPPLRHFPAAVSAGAAPRDAKEKALVGYVNAGEQASIALLEQIVNVNSGTMNFAGVRKVGELLRPRFEALGFKVTWVDGTRSAVPAIWSRPAPDVGSMCC